MTDRNNKITRLVREHVSQLSYDGYQLEAEIDFTVTAFPKYITVIPTNSFEELLRFEWKSAPDRTEEFERFKRELDSALDEARKEGA